jgi:dTDP-L-rhamnose 4-epimerase
MKRVLITGGLGFIGSHVAQACIDTGFSVRLLDNLSAQIHGPVPRLNYLFLDDPKVEVARGDIGSPCDWQPWLEGVDCVVHLAAETGTAQSMYEIYRYTNVNLSGTAGLLDYLANRPHKVTKIVLGSSRSVYGEGPYFCDSCGLVYPGTRTEESLRAGHWDPSCPKCAAQIKPVATREDAMTAPVSIYAATKLGQEDLVRIAGNALGIATVIYRFQNVYGEGQSLKNPYTGILSIFSNQLRQGKCVNIFEDGNESRDFIHVSDATKAILLAMTSTGADGLTLNVGSGISTSVAEMVPLLANGLGVRAQSIMSGQYRVGDIRHCFADIRAVRETLQFAPELSLDQGLDRFLRWVKGQAIEADRLEAAHRELLLRGIMAGVCG